MKPLKLPISLFTLILALALNAQNMQEGFSFLESGEYAKAEAFFSNILKDYSDNKTARLCYGRAIGLNGKEKEANLLFEALLKDYPNDFEVKLNYGESLLWNRDFKAAKSYYQDLVNEDPKSFAALLGFANTLSNLKLYEDALIYVNKALDVSKGNPNALTSKKYIYLGYAYQNQQAQQYSEAEQLLLKNIELFGDDKDTLVNLANLYLIWEKFDDAQNAYERLKKQPEHKIIALNGLALVSHLKNKEQQALALSNEAFNSLDNTEDSKIKQATTERYIQALIWNRKYKDAEQLINTLNTKTPNQNWILALRATLNIYKSNFKKSLNDYNQILANDSTSFDGNLGKANVLKALDRKTEAYGAAENTLNYYDKQKDAVNFMQQLDLSVSPTVETKVSHTFDNGDNKAYAFSTNVVYPLSTRLQLYGNYNFRQTDNRVTDNSANANSLSFGLSYKLIPNLKIKGIAGVNSAQADSNDYSQLISEIALSIKTFKLQSLDIGYSRQIESFNAELLEREIVQNNYFFNYNLSTNFNLGWYSQLIYTSQNDGNTRNLLFTSLYYNLLQKPSVKVGFNYQNISFKDQVPEIYFSPERFNAYELFINIVKDEAVAKPKEWFYNLTGAYGFQFIEDDPRQSAYRIQGALGYKFSNRSLLNVYGVHSNIASATAAGFTFTEIGLRFKWIFLKRSIK